MVAWRSVAHRAHRMFYTQEEKKSVMDLSANESSKKKIKSTTMKSSNNQTTNILFSFLYLISPLNKGHQTEFEIRRNEKAITDHKRKRTIKCRRRKAKASHSLLQNHHEIRAIYMLLVRELTIINFSEFQSLYVFRNLLL